MASQGPLYASTITNDTTPGGDDWVNVSKAGAADGSLAIGQTSNVTDYLKCQNYGFSIPSGATIDGIIVEIGVKSGSASFESNDERVSLVKSDGSFGSTNKANATTHPTTQTTKTYGSSSDLWGESWSDSDINDADFGVIFQADNVDFFGQCQVDFVRVTVHYTEGAGPSSTHPGWVGKGSWF